MISSLVFRGKSGQDYRFQVWAMDTKFTAVAGVYIVTSRTFEDRTFRTRASHKTLALGHCENLALPLFSKADVAMLTRKGANCLCVCAVADPELRESIAQDLLDADGGFGGLRYLVHQPVTQASTQAE